MRLAVTTARAPVRLSATVSSAWRHSSGSAATTRPARYVASAVSANSIVFGNCTAITELAGRPASTKCAASADMARSACAKVRRRVGRPVMRGLLKGSSSAKAFGCRARMRWKRTSRVGEALGWVTEFGCIASLASFLRIGLRLIRLPPPGFRQIARQRYGRRPFYPIPSGDPLLRHVKQGDSVEARHQDAVERPHRRDEGRPLPRLQDRRDQRINRGLLGAHVIACAGNIGGFRAPVEGLLIAGRERLIPAVLDHVELVTKPALVELHRIDGADAHLDAGALEVALVGKRNPLLVACCH